MIDVIVVVLSTITLIGSVIALSIWAVNACNPCNHSYRRIDTCNDKKMVLVCNNCGKIKKLRK